MDSPKEIDCLVIGAGIAGITAAIYLKRSALSFVVIDKGAPGGKLNNVHLIENYPGFNSISGPALAMNLYSQLKANGIDVTYGEAKGVKKEGLLYLVETDNGNYLCKSIIVATGMNFPGQTIQGERQFLGRGLSYCATCDGPLYRNKDVIVIGYSDRAKEEALYLSSICNAVHFVSPIEIDKEWASKPNNIIIHSKTKPISVVGKDSVEGIRVAKEGKEELIEGSALFPLLNEAPSLAFLSNLIKLGSNGFAIVDENGMSSLPGIFVVGDAVNKKLKQAIGAASDGAIAATSVISFLR